MNFSAYLFLALSATFASVLCQNSTTNSSCASDTTQVDSAVAWGIAGALPPVDKTELTTEGQSTSYTWLYSVQRDGRFNFSLATPPGLPVPNANSYWSVCFIELPLSPNVIERGQSDDGTCYATLDKECVSGIMKKLQTNGYGQKGGVSCDDARGQILNYAQDGSSSCAKYLKDIRSDSSYVINQATREEQPCREVSKNVLPGYTLQGIGGPAFNSLYTVFNETGNETTYYQALRDVRAVVTLYVRNYPEGYAGPTSTEDQFMSVNCVRITNFSSSDVLRAPKLPDPTPISAANGPTHPSEKTLAGAAALVILAISTSVTSALW